MSVQMLFIDCVEKTALFFGTMVSTNDGLKTISKITKSVTEIIKKRKEDKAHEVPQNIILFNLAASNFNSVLILLEPFNIFKDCVLGDKEKKKPWDYFRHLFTVPKGVSWTAKKISLSIEFFKTLDSFNVIHMADHLHSLSIVKACFDSGYAFSSIIDKIIAIYKAHNTLTQLQLQKSEWLNIKDQCIDSWIVGNRINYDQIKNSIQQLSALKLLENHHANTRVNIQWKTLNIYTQMDRQTVSDEAKVIRLEQYFNGQLSLIDEKIENQYRIRKKSVIAMTFSICLLAISVLSFFKELSQLAKVKAVCPRIATINEPALQKLLSNNF